MPDPVCTLRAVSSVQRRVLSAHLAETELSRAPQSLHFGGPSSQAKGPFAMWFSDVCFRYRRWWSAERREREKERAWAIRLVSVGQSRISIIINTTIKDAHLDCKASGTRKDTVKVFLVITHTHDVSCCCSLYSDNIWKFEEKPPGHSPTWLPIGIILLPTWIIPSGISAVACFCVWRNGQIPA